MFRNEIIVNIVGLMSWVLVIPFDVIKTITQAQPSDQHINMVELMKRKVNVSILAVVQEFL